MKRFFSLAVIVCISVALCAPRAVAQNISLTAAPQRVSPAKLAVPGFAVPKKSSPATSEGPDRGRRWEIEFHGGGMFGNNPDGGSSALPAAGATYTDDAGAPTRPVSSWMFGDGATLLNDFSAASGGAMTTTITPLDLNKQVGERTSGGGLGFRLGFDLNKRIGLEWSTDYTWTPIKLKGSFLANTEATRTTFANTFTDLVQNYCNCIGGGDAISDTRRRSEGGQLFNTLAANIYLRTSGKLVPYVTAGGGFVANVGPDPHAAILGHYLLGGLGGDEAIDTVNVTSHPDHIQGMGIIGFGAKYYVTSHWGFRFDFRDHIMGNGLNTRVDATPTLLFAGAPASPGTTPDIQFGSGATPDTFSGPAIRKFTTFKGDGVRNQFGANVGLFFRF